MNKFRLCAAFMTLLFLALNLGLTSCSKEETAEPVQNLENDMLYTSETLLAGDNSKNWLLTGWTYTQQGTVTDMYPTLPPCELDNIFTYFRNYEFKQFDGPVVCPAIPQSREGYWSLQKNRTQLRHTTGTNTFVDYRIKKLDHNDLVLEEVLRILAPGDTVFSTCTFVAQ